MIIAGTRTMGKVDEISGVGHVATTFFHVWFFPLVPVRSLFVVGESSQGVRGVQIPLAWKSVLAGYFRGWALMGGIALMILAGYCAFEVFDKGVFTRREVGASYNSNGVRVARYEDGGPRLEAFGAPLSFGLAVFGWLGALASYKLLGPSPARRAELLRVVGRST